MRPPSRTTEPSTSASTWSVLAISGAESLVSLRDITEVREMTRRPRIVDRRPMRASVKPSARYSCVGSPDRFFKGRTASDWIRGAGLEAKRRWRTWPQVNAKVIARMAARRPVAARSRRPRPVREYQDGLGDSPRAFITEGVARAVIAPWLGGGVAAVAPEAVPVLSPFNGEINRYPLPTTVSTN